MCRLTIDHGIALLTTLAATSSILEPCSATSPIAPPDRVQLPREVIPSQYSVTIAPHFANWTFDATVTIDCTARISSNTITLNCLDLDIRSAKIQRKFPSASPNSSSFPNPNTNSTTNPTSHSLSETTNVSQINYDRDEQTVTLSFPGTSFMPGEELRLNIEYSGLIGDNMVGFYRSSYTHEGKARPLAVTQFESVDCRRAIPSFDEPELKAVFNITLVVDENLTALSNTQVVSDTVSASQPGKRVVTFAPTPIMSTYLLAFAVGEFDYIEAFTKPSAHLEKPVRCRVYTPLGQAHLAKFALDVGVRSLEYFSEIFGIPYPLSKCDQIAIPDFSAGAMENWGLVTYRTVSLLVDDAEGSIESKKWVATTVTHELAHQWFGNLVTFRFWDELWLNEGFATWVGTLGAAHLFPDWDMWAIFIAEDQNSAFAADSVRSSHPIQVPVRDAKEIAQIFDNISYSKGAAVIHMLTNWLGLDAFLAGIRIYLAKFAYSNATTADLWACLSEASGHDVANFMDNWTSKVGYPVVNVSQQRDEKSGTLRLSLSQHRFLRTADVSEDDDQIIWSLPLDLAPVESSASINLVPVANASNSSTSSLDSLSGSFSGFNATLAERSIDLDLRIDSDCCLVNSRRGGFYRVAYDDASFAVIADNLAAGKVPSTATRMGIYNDAFALARGGVKSLTGFLSLVRKALPLESQYSVFLDVSLSLAAMRTAWAGQPEIVRKHLNDMRIEIFEPLAIGVGFDHKKSESELDLMLRPLYITNAGMAGSTSIVNEARRRFHALAAGEVQAVATDLYPAVMAISVAHGDETYLDSSIKIFETTSDIELRYAALSSLGYTRLSTAHFNRVLEYSMSDKVRPQDIRYIWGSLGSNPLARRTVFEFLMANWSRILVRYESNFDLFGSLVSAATRGFTTLEELEMVRKGFSDKDTRGCIRKLEDSYNEINSNIAWLERDAARVAAWLAEVYGQEMISKNEL